MGEYLMQGAVWLALGPYASSFCMTVGVSACNTCGLDKPGIGDDVKRQVEMRKDSQGNPDK
jgi:hypothetical protein